jgi:pimeloyl-ACP methyl ester carboxylesterase
VLLAGSGSDHVFVTAVFAQPLAALGIRLVAAPPAAGAGVVEDMWRSLDSAADPGTLVGGISLGAHLAARWAAANPGGCAGLLLALPGWVGAPGGPVAAPAAAAALASAAAVRRDGVPGALAAVHASAPARWVAAELDRAWRAHGEHLADALRVAAATPGPTPEELGGLALPAGVAALTDDPLHPHAVAARWTAAMPRAALVTTTLAAVGRDRSALGRAAVLAWLRAAFASGP